MVECYGFEWSIVEEYDRLPVFKTPFSFINSALEGGISTQSLVVITGDTGIGKSTLALQIAVNFWSSTQFTTYIYSGELHPAVVIKSVYQQLKIHVPKLSHLYGRSNGSIKEIQDDLKRLKPKFILIDNLMCLTCGIGDINQLQSQAVNCLREWAITYDAVVILVAHASKGNKDFNNKITLNSICGSSNIANQASLVLALNRLEDDSRSLEVLKNRKTGRLCEVILLYDEERKIYRQVQSGI